MRIRKGERTQRDPRKNWAFFARPLTVFTSCGRRCRFDSSASGGVYLTVSAPLTTSPTFLLP